MPRTAPRTAARRSVPSERTRPASRARGSSADGSAAKIAKGTSKARLREEFRAFARATILEAAEDVLASDGLYEARVEEIAKRARVAVGTIYNLVGDREALVAEIIGARRSELIALLGRTLATEDARPFRDQLQAFVTALFGYFREHGRFLRLVVEAERAHGRAQVGVARPCAQTMEQILALYRELIARGLHAGALDPAGGDLYPALLMGMLREVVLSDLESAHDGPHEARAARIVKLFLEGAGRR